MINISITIAFFAKFNNWFDFNSAFLENSPILSVMSLPGVLVLNQTQPLVDVPSNYSSVERGGWLL